MNIAPRDQGTSGKPLDDPWTPYEPGGDDPDFYFPAAHLDRAPFRDRLRQVFSRHHVARERD